MTYRYAQQTAEFVMPNEVLRNAKSVTAETANRSALAYKQEIHGNEGTSQQMWSDLLTSGQELPPTPDFGLSQS